PPCALSDTTPPPAAPVTFLASGTHYNAAGWNSTLSGTAADAASTVATVKLSIQDTTVGRSRCLGGTHGRRPPQLLGRPHRRRPLRDRLPQLHHRHRHHRLDLGHPRHRRPRQRSRL